MEFKSRLAKIFNEVQEQKNIQELKAKVKQAREEYGYRDPDHCQELVDAECEYKEAVAQAIEKRMEKLGF